MGWTSKGLLMTDRSAFSTEDGTAGWGNLDDASVSLLSTGYIFVQTKLLKLLSFAAVQDVIYLTYLINNTINIIGWGYE